MEDSKKIFEHRYQVEASKSDNIYFVCCCGTNWRSYYRQDSDWTLDVDLAREFSYEEADRIAERLNKILLQNAGCN